MDAAKADLIRAAQNMRDNWESNLSEALAQLMDALDHAEAKRDRQEEEYLAQAKAQYERDGEIEFDGDAVVSVSDDNGAYVQAWVWVEDEAPEHEAEDGEN